jgi:hypothetical protein
MTALASKTLLGPDDARVKAARELVAAQYTHYTTYHAHKETMAYAGFALYSAAAGAVISAAEWPPRGWGAESPGVTLTACAVLTLFWILILLYLHFCLARRRWGVLRMAGCERALVWLATRSEIDPIELEPASYNDVEADPPASAQQTTAPGSLALVLGAVPRLLAYPLGDEMRAVERSDRRIYPRFLMRAWKTQETAGTAAIWHERLILTAGWGVFAAMLIRTVWSAGWL